MLQVGVLGAGSFGTVLANIATDNGHNVKIWARDNNQVAYINQHKLNHKYLPGYQLNKDLIATNEIEVATRDKDIIIIAVPSASFTQTVIKALEYINKQTHIISVTKGISGDSFQSMSQVLEYYLTKNSNYCNQIGALSGPNLAQEIANKNFTASVVATNSRQVFESACKILNTNYLRLYLNDDVYGVELCGALKNIYAIATGLTDAMNMGNNTRSMLLTRSLTEMSRFCVPLGAKPMTFIGLAGLGDLVATCTSRLSRNYRVGYSIGKGEKINNIITNLNQVAEGVNTLKIVYSKAQQENIPMPIAMGLYDIIFNNQPVQSFIDSLMQTKHIDDVEYLFHPSANKQ